MNSETIHLSKNIKNIVHPCEKKSTEEWVVLLFPGESFIPSKSFIHWRGTRISQACLFQQGSCLDKKMWCNWLCKSSSTLLRTNISPPKIEDDVSFPKVGYLSSLEGNREVALFLRSVSISIYDHRYDMQYTFPSMRKSKKTWNSNQHFKFPCNSKILWCLNTGVFSWCKQCFLPN